MRMKEDAMNNGQTKPGYNLQVGTENQFITDFSLFPNPTDILTLIHLFSSFSGCYNRLPGTAVADSGYGSEENYRFMEEHEIKAFVKYNWFHKEQKRSFKNNPFLVDNLYYNAKDDYYVCPKGQHMTFGVRLMERLPADILPNHIATGQQGAKDARFGQNASRLRGIAPLKLTTDSWNINAKPVKS